MEADGRSARSRQPRRSPDGKWIAFTSDANPEDLVKQKRGKGATELKTKPDEKTPDEMKPESGPATKSDAAKAEPAGSGHESDVRVITRSVYRLNGVGYLDEKHPQHLWVVAAPQGSEDMVTPRQLTSGKFQEDGAFWATDSATIFFSSTKVEDPSYELPHAEIYSVPVSGGEARKVAGMSMAPRSLSLSPDGKRIAFCASVNEPVHSYTQPDLWVMDLAENAKPRNLTANYDFDVCSGVGGDQGTPRAGGSDKIAWSRDGNSLSTITAEQGRANLALFDLLSGKIKPLTKGNQAVERYRATEGGSKFVVLISTPTNIGDLFWSTEFAQR